MPDPTNLERLEALEVDAELAVDVAAIAAAEAKRVAKAENRTQRRNAVIGYVTLLLAVLAVFVTSQNDAEEARTAIVTSGKVVSVAGCNQDFDTTLKIQKLFARSLAGLKVQHDNGNITDEQYKVGKDFYTDQLASFTLPDCRKVEKIITSDPRKTHYPPPFPRYPGDGR